MRTLQKVVARVMTAVDPYRERNHPEMSKSSECRTSYELDAEAQN
jgi:hypothetical protein